MYAIVTHNATGTVYGLVRGFPSIEAAEAYRRRYAYIGVSDSPIIRESDEPEIRRINDRWSPEARRLYLG
jgi:hypothetical protein